MIAMSNPRPLPNGNCFELAGVAQTRGNRTVLSNLTVNLPDGGLTALIGPSGSGKTSLLRLLNRLDDPVAGDIRFHGQPLSTYPVRSIRRRVGFVFQAPTMFPGTVADNLLTAHQLGRNRKETLAPDRIQQVLGTVELDADFASREARGLQSASASEVERRRQSGRHWWPRVDAE